VGFLLSEPTFARFSRWLAGEVGLHLPPQKRTLVQERIAKRLRALGMTSYEAYFKLVTSPEGLQERQQAIDLITTHETYFFRKPRHFELLQGRLLAGWPAGRPLRLWSAACSTGEEVYSLAMLLQHSLGDRCPWEILGTDVSEGSLARARTGHYANGRIDGIPPHFLRSYLLKGTGPQAGTLLVSRALRQRVAFEHLNLVGPPEAMKRLGLFDAIFLRNVLIYFDTPTKQEVVARVLERLRPGGFFFLGHSESLNGVNSSVHPVAPAAYRK